MALCSLRGAVSPKYPLIERMYAATLDQKIRKNQAAAEVLSPELAGSTSIPSGLPISTNLAAE